MSPAPPPSPWVRVFLPFALGYYLSYLLRTVNAVISPALRAEFGLSAADLGLLTSAYFLTFAIAQIPVGIALDRFGPRRVEGVLMVLTALGAASFALSDDLRELSLARALIGVGVSACLMGALKGIALWYPPERHASMTAFVMASGALGALTASLPLEAALPLIGWRGAFWVIAVLALAAAALLLHALPRAHPPVPRASLGAQLRTVVAIYAAPAMLRLGTASVFMVGGFMAMQGLWAVPWVIEVDGLTLADAARVLLMLNLGALLGQLGIGFFATRLGRRGFGPRHLLKCGWSGMLLAELAILAGLAPPTLLWFALGVMTAASSQSYLCAAQYFPSAVFARVSTALNQLSFVGAFAVQWGMGIAIDQLARFGHSPAAALQWTFAGLIVLQLLTWLTVVGMRAPAAE